MEKSCFLGGKKYSNKTYVHGKTVIFKTCCTLLNYILLISNIDEKKNCIAYCLTREHIFTVGMIKNCSSVYGIITVIVKRKIKIKTITRLETFNKRILIILCFLYLWCSACLLQCGYWRTGQCYYNIILYCIIGLTTFIASAVS